MWVRKQSGGTTITHRRVQYEWPEDGAVIDVPPELGADLLHIRGGGFSEAPEPKPEPVTEPSPAEAFSEVDPAAEGDATDKPKRGPGRKSGTE